MSKETARVNNDLREVSRLRSASLTTFNLPGIIERMKHERTWSDGGLNAMVLLKKPESSIVLAAMHDGMKISSFHSGIFTTVQILEGNLFFNTFNKSVELEKGQMLTINQNVSYCLATDNNAIILLTIVNKITKESKRKVG